MPNPNELITTRDAASELVEPYALLRPESSTGVLQLLEENLGSQNFSILNLPRIQVPAGGAPNFRVQTLAGEEAEKEIEGIIVAWRPARIYWQASYAGGGSGKPPDCTSTDGRVGIGNPGGRCAECPYAQFGSALQPNGQPGSGQACKDIRQVLLLRPDEILPHLLNVTPTSIKAFTQYTMNLLSGRAPYWTVTTKLTLEKATSEAGKPYSKIVFRLGKRLDQDRVAMLAPYHQKMKEVLTPSILDVSDYTVYESETTAQR